MLKPCEPEDCTSAHKLLRYATAARLLAIGDGTPAGQMEVIMSLELKSSTAAAFNGSSNEPAAPAPLSPADPALDEPGEYDDGLLAVAGPIIITCYTLLFAVAAATFFSTGAALFAVVVSIAFAVVFFAIPLTFFHLRAANDTRWRRDAVHSKSKIVETRTGPMRRWEAVVQIVTIPVVILLAFTALSIRWALL